MKVFVAGATGVVGWRAVRELVAAGHDVTGLARSADKAALLERLGATPATFDVLDGAAVLTHASGYDAVVNLLTHIPRMAMAAVPGAFKQNNSLREHASGCLAAAALAGGGRFVQESITFPYADAGDAWITEESPLLQSKFLASTNTAEANGLGVNDKGGTGVVLRFAQFYSADSHHTVDQVAAARRGIASVPGKADGYWSYIYADDAARAAVAALTAPGGIYNVAEDDPLTRREAAAILAAALGKKKVRTGAAGVLGKMPGQTVSVMTSSNRISNKKFKEATGWSPQVPSQREGWPLILKEMAE